MHKNCYFQNMSITTTTIFTTFQTHRLRLGDSAPTHGMTHCEHPSRQRTRLQSCETAAVLKPAGQGESKSESERGRKREPLCCSAGESASLFACQRLFFSPHSTVRAASISWHSRGGKHRSQTHTHTHTGVCTATHAFSPLTFYPQ